MRRSLFALAGLGLLAVAAAVQAAELPGLRLTRDGAFLALLPPASVLNNVDVKPRLSTGLTTSISIQVALRDGAGTTIQGAARIDIRYELWDEVFLVHGVGIDGRRFDASLPSFDRLVAWWREHELPVVAVRTAGRGAPWTLKVQVRVIPFSQSEQRDAQRWLSDSVRQGSPGDDSDSGNARRSTGVLDLLVGTSIQRRALVGYDWSLSFTPDRPAERREPKP